jgi:D-beta-D-heptose 7-phosphate kinase/D-beta-D-heptose 1-phosphate adenosyltransferase
MSSPLGASPGSSTGQDLLATLVRIPDLSMLVVGDIILDRYIWGRVDRISPEAPVPVVEVQRVEDRLGGAANVARNLRSLGARVSLCGFIGDDEEGSKVLALLEEDGIEREGIIIDRGRPTSLKTRVVASRQQLVRIDREKKGSLGAGLSEGFAALVDTHLRSANGVVVSDYGKGAISDALVRRLAAARAEGALAISSRPLLLDPHPTHYTLYRDIPIVKPNRKEAEAAVGFSITDKESAKLAGEVLIKLWNSEMVMITLGEDGLMILARDGSEPIFRTTSAREVFDVSGAGDTVTAVFTAALAAGASVPLAGDLANVAAGIVVSEVGTVAVSLEKLKAEIATAYGS